MCGPEAAGYRNMYPQPPKMSLPTLNGSVCMKNNVHLFLQVGCETARPATSGRAVFHVSPTTNSLPPAVPAPASSQRHARFSLFSPDRRCRVFLNKPGESKKKARIFSLAARPFYGMIEKSCGGEAMKASPIAHRRVLDYAYMDIDTLYRDFHISDQGYSDAQAEESRAQYGTNRLSGRASDTVLYRLRPGLS